MGKKLGADPTLINSAKLGRSQAQVEKASTGLKKAIDENWPPGKERCSMDREVMKQMKQPLELLGILVKAFETLQDVDANSVKNVKKVFEEAQDMTLKLAKSVDLSNVPTRT